jgi:alanine dehydrogenase
MMRSGTIIIDFAIDNGGCIETSRPTTLMSPTFVVENVVHHCVPNITAAVARSTSRALTYAALPYLLQAAEADPDDALSLSNPLRHGLNMFQGKLANEALAAALGRDVEIDVPLGE